MQNSTSPNDYDDDSAQHGPPPKQQRSQKDQDADDDKARQKAQENLVQSWMDRLQLISVITTFFAANEAQLLSITTPSDDPDSSTAIQQTANAMLSGALVLHSFSAVVAFIGAFVLVRYKLKEAKKQEAKEEGKTPSDKSQSNGGIYSTNPHIEQVGYFRQKAPPVHLLYRTHSIAIITAFVGFVFGIVGIVCYAWSQQARSVGIFSSACIVACIGMSAVILSPLVKAEEN